MVLRRLLVAVLLGGGLLVAAPATAWDADWGRVWRGDAVLQRGCHDYAFRYRVRPGHHDWGAEFFLVGPGREGLGTVNRLSGHARKKGGGRFEICRSSTRPGKFRIRGRLTVIRGYENDHHWIRPARFRLRHG